MDFQYAQTDLNGKAGTVGHLIRHPENIQKLHGWAKQREDQIPLASETKVRLHLSAPGFQIVEEPNFSAILGTFLPPRKVKKPTLLSVMHGFVAHYAVLDISPSTSLCIGAKGGTISVFDGDSICPCAYIGIHSVLDKDSVLQMGSELGDTVNLHSILWKHRINSRESFAIGLEYANAQRFGWKVQFSKSMLWGTFNSRKAFINSETTTGFIIGPIPSVYMTNRTKISKYTGLLLDTSVHRSTQSFICSMTAFAKVNRRMDTFLSLRAHGAHSEVEVGLSQSIEKSSRFGFGVSSTLKGIFSFHLHFSIASFSIDVPIELPDGVLSVSRAALLLGLSTFVLSVFGLLQRKDRAKKEDRKLIAKSLAQQSFRLARSQQILMRPKALESLDREKATDGLVILEARFGVDVDVNLSRNNVDELPKWIDVRVPLQFWVSNSSLCLGEFPKSGMLGFCKTMLSGPFELYVKYSYAGKIYETTVEDRDVLILPNTLRI